MDNPLLCIFCDNALGPDTKPEHILPNALGGRKTTRRVICSDCNNRFGSTIDDALAKQVEIIRNLLQLESGTGKPPPMLRNVQAGTEKVTFRNDGQPELVTPPFTVTERPDGTAEVAITVKTPEELRRFLPHIAARLRMSEDELVKQMEGGTGVVVERRPGEVHHHISFGKEDAIRSVAKSCLVLLATLVGNDAVKSDAFKEARTFVLTGSKEFNEKRVTIDSRPVPGVDDLIRVYGMFFNLIYVRSDSAGRVIGHFTLYNAISWQIVLAEAGGPAECKSGLVSNPLDPTSWSDAIADTVNIPFAWLDAADKGYELERARQRLISMAQYHHDESQQAEIARIVNDVCAKYGIKSDNDPIDPAHQEAIFNEITARLAAHAMHQPYEQRLTADQMKKLLKGESSE
ncbi:hypothetical protein Nwi_0258 [Nitrobacter winogradskyi Nb-255]|uniref:HNH endonuclease 5 domain-containing protein n=1 Tax=Nitrobacter winogradskyi (strain ATCC 25391 / DSM 10237 / CIP 104748 / NCIMB 11846 / Nb-255) TaxID=323098 RepID=Q3SW16_NITWN|nr:HNH endonuclease [Nitrobacter winogradskyi]ABA03525.1 hypothetical protein Nwi_0258 [Nitrobacter winogradskyi Nb-255]